jgi:hypothetical protein
VERDIVEHAVGLGPEALAGELDSDVIDLDERLIHRALSRAGRGWQSSSVEANKS